MKTRLSTGSVLDYLLERDLCSQQEQEKIQIEPVAAKNFNLLVTFPDGQKLLVKQERHNQEGKAAGEFLSEWRIQEFLQHFSELSHLRSFIPEVLYFDAENSIIIFRWLNDHQDLTDFYTKENIFPTEIASSIGTVLATLHRDTFNHQDYRDFFSQNPGRIHIDPIRYVVGKLERVEPEVFGQAPPDVLKFIALYQRYESLGKAVSELADALAPCCLTHNDLKLNNVLLHNDWEQSVLQFEQSGNSIVRLVDWERSSWGDPAFDLGTIIGNYLLIWLNSLVIDQTLTIEESLRLAMTPLEQLQPSIGSLTRTYINNFPEIIEYRSDFLLRVVQFSGFALIQQIRAMLQQKAFFGNTGICLLQIAKTLSCHPEQSISTVFGTAASELIPIRYSRA